MKRGMKWYIATSPERRKMILPCWPNAGIEPKAEITVGKMLFDKSTVKNKTLMRFGKEY
jgi:hypothetical protein